MSNQLRHAIQLILLLLALAFASATATYLYLYFDAPQVHKLSSFARLALAGINAFVAAVCFVTAVILSAWKR
jgi:cytochrome c oxidase subunit IV